MSLRPNTITIGTAIEILCPTLCLASDVRAVAGRSQLTTAPIFFKDLCRHWMGKSPDHLNRALLVCKFVHLGSNLSVIVPV
jgi:hypothetical protein